MWWGLCTLTAVGYGDIYPHTVLGKICGGLTSIAGIGLIAMPTGILAAAFSDAFQCRRIRRDAEAAFAETDELSVSQRSVVEPQSPMESSARETT